MKKPKSIIEGFLYPVEYNHIPNLREIVVRVTVKDENNRSKQIQNLILRLLRIKTRTITALHYMMGKHISNITAEEFEENLNKLEKLGKVKIVNLIYVKIKF